MEHHSTEHKELSEQLDSWWRTQTDFKAKKALAGFLKVHPDTIGDYFSGKNFPRPDIANRLYELTNINLENNVDIGKYTICNKCNDKWTEIIKYYTNSD